MESRIAIILAAFGTSYEQAVPDLLHLRNRIEESFPGTAVHLAFTSKIIRRIWLQRSKDTVYIGDHPGIPAGILHVRDPLTAIAELRDTGCRSFVVQPAYMIPADEYTGLLEELEALHKDPSLQLAVARPILLEQNGKYVLELATALAADAQYAAEKGAALLYMGHGSKQQDWTPVYREFAAAMNRLYPKVFTAVATLEGGGGLEEVIGEFKDRQVGRLVLKPLMIVAGSHAENDMLGPGPQGWKSRLENAGFAVDAVLRGLGGQDGFADLLVGRITEAAEAAGVRLAEKYT